ncbi:immunoglobulin iota chain [Meriones unguiculatus]|uniref:immunoglobulin iota chain n=1 Tax=Meriones unguiculatus TaxID=10047 RepID=UPI00293ED7A9|nr:immunoglobulin iota chain [Meriones unguiculatus]
MLIMVLSDHWFTRAFTDSVEIKSGNSRGLQTERAPGGSEWNLRLRTRTAGLSLCGRHVLREPVSLPLVRGGHPPRGCGEKPTERGPTTPQPPHGEGEAARRARQARTLPHAPARAGAPLPFRKCLRKARVFRFLKQLATHCSPAVPLQLSLRPCSPGGHSRTHFRLCPLVAFPHLLSDVDTSMSASSAAGCGSQPMLHQPPSASSSLGATVRLTCTLSRNLNIRVYSIYWYQQRPGHPPRFLLSYFSHLDKHQGPKVPPRFSGSKDMARNLGYLSISELQAEDEAVYYCAVGPRSQEKKKGMERLWRGEK